jgi:hypothetical protein
MESDEYEYSGFWVRAGATIIDTILLLLITTPIIVTVYGWSYFTDESYGIIAGPADFLISWVLPAIAVIAFWMLKQATPGKMAISSKIHNWQSCKHSPANWPLLCILRFSNPSLLRNYLGSIRQAQTRVARQACGNSCHQKNQDRPRTS